MTDEEQGIVNAVQSILQRLVVCCWNHVFNNMKSFVTMNCGWKEEAQVYKDDITRILQPKPEEDFLAIFDLKISQKPSQLVNLLLK